MTIKTYTLNGFATLEIARPEKKNLGLEKLALSLFSHFRKREVAAIPLKL